VRQAAHELLQRANFLTIHAKMDPIASNRTSNCFRLKLRGYVLPSSGLKRLSAVSSTVGGIARRARAVVKRVSSWPRCFSRAAIRSVAFIPRRLSENRFRHLRNETKRDASRGIRRPNLIHRAVRIPLPLAESTRRTLPQPAASRRTANSSTIAPAQTQ
jgi:hypothetical protein